MLKTHSYSCGREDWRPGVTTESLRQEMTAAPSVSRVSNAWTCRSVARDLIFAVDGHSPPVGIKVYGDNLTNGEE